MTAVYLAKPRPGADLFFRVGVPVVQIEGQRRLRVRRNRHDHALGRSLPASTKQKLALVLSPTPNCSGHVTSAGSVLGTGFGAGTGFFVVVLERCANGSPPAAR